VINVAGSAKSDAATNEFFGIGIDLFKLKGSFTEIVPGSGDFKGRVGGKNIFINIKG